MKLLLDLFWTFAKIGGFTFGGGYAMLPMLQKEVVDNRHWASEEELMDYYAIGQCTPGVIAVNTATFIGYNIKGILGAVFATFGVVAPSLVIITVIALFLKNFAHYPIVQHAFGGVTVCVCVLILSSVLRLGKKSITDIFGIFIFLFTFILSVFADISPVILVLISGIFGIFFSAIKTAGILKKGGKS
jgi:chromate transporter